MASFRTSLALGPPSDLAVDKLADESGIAVVPGVLLDHVPIDAAPERGLSCRWATLGGLKSYDALVGVATQRLQQVTRPSVGDTRVW